MGCITLVSDLGLQDASVAIAKGILLKYAPGLPVVDISHYVEPYHIQQAAYLLKASGPYFPEGTCHIALCDVFSVRNPVMLVCVKDGNYFIVPDNGLLSLAFGNNIEEVYKCTQLADNKNFKDWIQEAALLALKLQDRKPADLGLEATTLKRAPMHWRPRIDGSMVECHVMHTDRFENVVINITKDEFDSIGRGRPFKIEFAKNEAITEISNHYSDVREGEKLCRFNSVGYLEIAMNKGNAAGLFGLQMRRDKHIVYNTINIYFL